MIKYMDKYWLSNTGDNDGFWTHEFNKHGTCVSTIDPSCIQSYSAGAEVFAFVNATINLFNTLDSFKALKDENIIPNSQLQYNLSSVNEALKKVTGVIPTVQCQSGGIKEIWYYFHVNGSIIDGDFKAFQSLGRSNCPSQVRFPPKKHHNSSVPTISNGTDSFLKNIYFFFFGRFLC
ncbi:Ribonuclease T2 [Neolecta irregularis DAH-3]|uniref:ribonuclease T2 n=1 Tax=Neolecta irregularis (strain DAH-3) TaxID=1198029 RepID=A0A1U7LWB3_NEOID|nr:Ribonuclease T2 [Neolecta irregularis DAH-3]|eukprot:OLL26970.1 Ribonuclease T2 [Neolecta irregularis DAH-3]